MAGGAALILFSMVHFVLLPGFRVFEDPSRFQEISISIPRTYLLHDMQKSYNPAASAVVSAR